GLKSIETLQIGDQVLTQDVERGTLRLEPVIGAWHNPPDVTYRLSLGDETIVATGIHRFWKAGHGWTMLRDLKTNDLVRTSRGVVEVRSIVENSVEPVFNLELSLGRSFFVGKVGALVHDYSLIETVDHPFDAVKAPSGSK